MYHRVKRN